jgi:tryptophan halogenase
MKQIKKILVVGGGSAGWMAAGYLSTIPGLEIALVESKIIPTIGVGESTIPSIVDFMEDTGITEEDLINNCSAVRKYGIQHNNWNGNDDTWMHMFADAEDQLPEQYQWMQDRALPNKKHRWSYHLDATKFSSVVRDKCGLPNGVKHYFDDIVDVVVEDGVVKKIVGDNAEYTADLYIDCSGWKAIIRNKLGAEFQSHPYLINDYAWCGPGQYLDNEEPLPYTQTFSMDYGWRWRVCIQHRTGNGYAFNKDLISIEDARKEFIEKTPGLIVDKVFLVPIHNKFNPEPWKGNVIALGLSCGFLEPLEATGLFLVHGPLTVLKRLINDNRAPEKYNRVWQRVYKNIAHFLSTFYQSSSLDHTEYWKTFEKIKQVDLPPPQSMTIFRPYNYKMLAKGMELSINE